ncbi:hypothetical protein SADUNF_Sadunf16G0284500 [Salix dunnii]|uniref:Uncharacterized protein n=1 Tax=Salix dunnii TaxID=1413687 RepID=A0A835JCM0_9ROSI|nr:hypothetical protein SADUNF_Sadunf16G0284500 [Salix dunnii]
MDLMMKPLAPRRNVSNSIHRKQRKLKKKRETSETMERLKTDMVEIGEGQKRIREGQREIRQKFEEIESECRRLKEETMNIASQSDYNQIRINLMLGILKARQDSDFALADRLTRLLRLGGNGKAGTRRKGRTGWLTTITTRSFAIYDLISIHYKQ